MDLFLQHIIITGGSSGIGKALANLLAKQAANLTIIARDEEKLNQAQLEIVKNCISQEQIILAFSVDVSQQEEITTAIETATQKLGTPQILITSAGFAHPDYFTNLTTDIFTKTMAVNYFGTLYCLHKNVQKSRNELNNK